MKHVLFVDYGTTEVLLTDFTLLKNCVKLGSGLRAPTQGYPRDPRGQRYGGIARVQGFGVLLQMF